MANFVSPNDILKAAKEHMLDSREPESHEDWTLVMNFMALNVYGDCAEPACQLLAVIYGIPLTREEITEIVNFQLTQKK